MVAKKGDAIIIHQRREINRISEQYTSTCSESVDVGQAGCTEAKFIVPDRGIHYIRLWQRVVVPARQPMQLGGRYDNPMPWSTMSLSQGL
jgi:hypothetical protein